MKNRIRLTTTLLSLTLLSGTALANNVGQDAETDLLYGHRTDTLPHQAQPAVLGPQVAQGIQDDILYSGKGIHADKGEAPLPGAAQDNHGNNTSLLHR